MNDLKEQGYRRALAEAGLEPRILGLYNKFENSLEAFKEFFKELFDTDIQNSDGEYRSIHDVFSEASKKFNSKTDNITM